MIKEKFINAFEPEVAINIAHIGKSNKEALCVLGKLVQFLTKEYYHLTDAPNQTIYLKRKEKT